jgi:predicted Zn-dependent protease
MSEVKRVRRGIRLRLEPEEATLVRMMTEQMLALLGEPDEAGDPLAAALGISENADRPDDPVLARLFPDAYQEDAGAAREFRRYTEMGLRDGKREAAGIVLATVRPDEDVLLDRGQAQAWLRALNDVRLALGTRLDITEEWYEEVAELDRDDPRFAMYAAYDWLTMLQEQLVQALF